MATAGVIEGSGSTSFTGSAVNEACYILKLYFRDFCDFIFFDGEAIREA